MATLELEAIAPHLDQIKPTRKINSHLSRKKNQFPVKVGWATCFLDRYSWREGKSNRGSPQCMHPGHVTHSHLEHVLWPFALVFHTRGSSVVWVKTQQKWPGLMAPDPGRGNRGNAGTSGRRHSAPSRTASVAAAHLECHLNRGSIHPPPQWHGYVCRSFSLSPGIPFTLNGLKDVEVLLNQTL